MTTQAGTPTNDTLVYAPGDTLIDGKAGTDTLQFGTTDANLATTTLTSVEILAATVNDTVFKLDQADLFSGGSILGTAGTADEIKANGSTLDLSSTTVTDVEKLSTGFGSGTNGTTFTLKDATQLAGFTDISGGAATTDALVVKASTIDVSAKTLTDLDILKAGLASATTFKVGPLQLAGNGGSIVSIFGSSGSDTLTVAGTDFDLSATSLTSVEKLLAISDNTRFTINQDDLASGGSIIGSSSTTDDIRASASTLDLSSTTITGVEALTTQFASGTNGTTFTLSQNQFSSGTAFGSFTGSGGADTLVVKTTNFDVSGKTLSDIDGLKAGVASATTFQVDQAQLGTSKITGITGSSGSDTLKVTGNATIDLTTTALTSVEKIVASLSTGTTFKVDQADLASGGSVVGHTSAADELIVKSTNGSIDLTSTTLTSIEVISSGDVGGGSILVDQNDLSFGGVVNGSTGADTLKINGSQLDLTSTTLNSVEGLAAGKNVATTFIVDAADLANNGTVTGSALSGDTLIVKDASFDVSATTLSGIEVLKGGVSTATTFTLQGGQLKGDAGSVTSIVGSTGSDVLIVNNAAFDLSQTSLTSVEKLQAGVGGATNTVFKLDQLDLVANGSVIGTAGATGDEIQAMGSTLDLSSTNLSSIEVLSTAFVSGTNGTTFTLKSGQLADITTIKGSSASASAKDTLVVKEATIDLSTKVIDNLEIVKAGVSIATTFSIDESHLGATANDALVSSFVGSTGSDILVATGGTAFDLSATTLTSVEQLKAGSNDTVFTVDQADLASGGSVIGIGGTANDIRAAGSTLDLTSSTLTTIQKLSTAFTGTAGTAFTVTQSEFTNFTSISGGTTSKDSLAVKSTGIDVSTKTLTGLEILKAGLATATTITVDESQLAGNTGPLVSIVGSSGVDTLSVDGTNFDLSGTSLTSVEKLVALSDGTIFLLDKEDLVSGGSVTGIAAGATDEIHAAGSTLDLTSTTVTNVEKLDTEFAGGTAFTVSQSQFGLFTAFSGDAGTDVLTVKSTTIDVHTKTLTDLEGLKAGVATATTFTVDPGQLGTGKLTQITGSSGVDTLAVSGNGTVDLTSTTLTSVEKLQALVANTDFVVDQADLAANGSVIGTTGVDSLTVLATDSAVFLTSTTLTSIEQLKIGGTDNSAITLDQLDLASGGSVFGVSGKDNTLIINGSLLDLTSTTLTDINILQAGKAAATTFKVDFSDLASGGQVNGSTGVDTLIVATGGTGFNVSSTTLNSIEVLQAGNAGGVTITLKAGQLKADGGSVATIIGSTGSDTLTSTSALIDLRSTTLTSIENLQATANDTDFKVDQADLANNGSITGSGGTADEIDASASSLDLSSTNLSGIEKLSTEFAGGTTFTLKAGQLAGFTDIVGINGVDTLVAKDTAFDLGTKTLSAIENLKAGVSSDTTFTVNEADLKSNGGEVVTVVGSTGKDTLVVAGADFDLSSVTLTSVEKLQGGVNDTLFTVDQTDLANGGSIIGIGGTANDIRANGSTLDLTSTSLTSIQKLSTLFGSGTNGTTFTLKDAAQLAGLTDISGGASTKDTLVVKASTIDLATKTLTDLEILKAGLATATTIIVDDGQLAANTGPVVSILGSSGVDTLQVDGTDFDLSGTSLTSVEKLVALSDGTIFVLDKEDLVSGGSVTGVSGGTADEIHAAGSTLDLTSTTVSNVEKLATDFASGTNGTLFTVSQAEFNAFTDISGSTGTDTLVVKGSTIDASTKTLTDLEVLKAGLASNTTFTVDAGQLGTGKLTSIVGSSGIDTLAASNAGTFDLTTTLLTSIEKLQAGNAGATDFVVDQADLAANGSVVGSSGIDSLTVVATNSSVLLTSTTLTSIEQLKIGGTDNSSITLDQADLASGGSVFGVSGKDNTLIINGTSLDLTSTTLTDVNKLQAGKNTATIFTVDAGDLVAGGTVVGSTGIDTLAAGAGGVFDLTSTNLTSIEVLKAGTSAGTNFKVDQNDLASNGSVIGHTSSTDTLTVIDDNIFLTSTTLTSVEKIVAGGTDNAVIMLDQVDLASNGSVVGVNGKNTEIIINGTSLDLTSTTLTDVNELTAGKSTATTFTVDANDLVSGGSVNGSSGIDTLIVKGTDFNVASTSLSSIEILKAGVSSPTTFTVDGIGGVGSIIGSTGSDTLLANSGTLNLTSTSLTSIEKIQFGAAGQITLNQIDLAAGGTVEGSGGTDILTGADSKFDLTGTTVNNVEVISTTYQSGTTGTLFTVDQADLMSGGTVQGSGGQDTLVVKGTTVDLSSTTIDSVEVLKASSASNTNFIVDKGDLGSGKLTSIVGSTGTDTVTATSSELDLTSTTLTSIEALATKFASGTDGTAFTINQSILTGGIKSITGSSGTDSILVDGNLDLSSTTLSSIEKVTVTTGAGVTLKVTGGQLATLSVTGGAGTDILVVAGTNFDLTSTTLADFEALQAGSSLATTFTVDLADLTALTGGGSITGSTGSDTLIVKDADFNLVSTTLSSVEKLQAGVSAATTFKVVNGDLASGGSVIGSSGSDTILALETQLNLTSTTLTSIETLKAGNAADTIFTVTKAQVGSGGLTAVTGSTGSDTLTVVGTDFDLTTAAVTNVEKLVASANGTTFRVDQGDLANGGSVTGNTGSTSIDTLTVKGASADLTSTTLTSIDKLVADATAGGTTFTVDQADLAVLTSVVGSTGTDTLIVKDGAIDLTSTTLTSIEAIKAGLSGNTTIKVDNDDIKNVTVYGSTGTDTLTSSAATGLDLTSTTLNSIEKIEVTATGADITLDQADLKTGGSVTASDGTLFINGTSLDLSNTTLSGVEELATKSTSATTFTLLGTALKAGGGDVTTITGSTSAGDTVSAADTAFNLSSTTLSGIEKLTGTDDNTTYTLSGDNVDQLAAGTGAAIVGGADVDDKLVITTGDANFSNIAVTGIEEYVAGASLTITLNQEDIISGGSITASNAGDFVLVKAAGTSLNLAFTTLTDIDQIGTTQNNTTLTLKDTQLANLSFIQGTGGTNSADDTVIVRGTDADFSSTTLVFIDVVKAGTSTAATTFTLDASEIDDLASIVGSDGQDDTLTFKGATFDLSSIALTSVEHLLAGVNSTTFTLNQDDLASGGTVEGIGGTNIIVAAETSLDLTSTTLTSIDEVQTGLTTGTTFTLDSADLGAITILTGAVRAGTEGFDTLVVTSGTIDVSAETLNDIDYLQTGVSTGTTFTVGNGQLGGTTGIVKITGDAGGTDILIVKQTGNTVDLTATKLDSVETIKVDNPANSTTFKVGDGEGGATIDLTVNNKSDTIQTSSAYAIGSNTADDTAINAHILAVDHFKVDTGANNGDLIDLSLLNSGATSSVDLSGYISLADPQTLKEALDIAAIGNGSSTSKIVQFEYDGDTYVLIDNSAEHTLQSGDSVIKLTGVTTPLDDTDNLKFA